VFVRLDHVASVILTPSEEFREQVARARANEKIALVRQILADKDWRAKAWYLERCWPAEFGRVADRPIPKAPPETERSPVTFRYKRDYDATRIRQFGLVAEEVAKVNPDLALLDRDGKPYTVRYEEVNAMLLNEFLKEHRKVQQLQSTVASLAATVKEQAVQIQKVSAQLEMHKPAAKVVVNRP
jgi:hypothetical protein